MQFIHLHFKLLVLLSKIASRYNSFKCCHISLSKYFIADSGTQTSIPDVGFGDVGMKTLGHVFRLFKAFLPLLSSGC